MSALYSTAFFYTHWVVVGAGCIGSIMTIFATRPLGISGRMSAALLGYSGIAAVALTIAIGVVHVLWRPGPGGLRISNFMPLDAFGTLGPVVALLFVAVAGTGWLIPRTSS
ncbi:MAG: hypothetical protein ABL982_21685 [Vicinamibacterales bacterium]